MPQRILVLELVCSGVLLECEVSAELTLKEMMEGLYELCDETVQNQFDLSQPAVLCDGQSHRILDETKTVSQLGLPDGFKILIY